MIGYLVIGEVSDSGSGSGSDGESEDDEKFNDGYDENLIGDEEDRKMLEQMTEKEREQEIFNRIEKREVLKTRHVHIGLHTPGFFILLFIIMVSLSLKSYHLIKYFGLIRQYFFLLYDVYQCLEELRQGGLQLANKKCTYLTVVRISINIEDDNCLYSVRYCQH